MRSPTLTTSLDVGVITSPAGSLCPVSTEALDIFSADPFSMFLEGEVKSLRRAFLGQGSLLHINMKVYQLIAVRQNR